MLCGIEANSIKTPSPTQSSSLQDAVVWFTQNFRFAAPLADRFYVMEHGRIVEGFAAAALPGKMAMLHEFLGV